MSIDQREQIKFFGEWAIKIFVGILATLATITFMDIRDSIKGLSAEIKTVSNDLKKDINGVNERLIRVETKIELHK